MIQPCQSWNFIFFIGLKLFSPCFLALFSKSKSNVKVNVLIFTQIIFSDALSFPTMGERCHCLSLSISHIDTETAKPQTIFFKKNSASSTICI